MNKTQETEGKKRLTMIINNTLLKSSSCREQSVIMINQAKKRITTTINKSSFE